MWLSTEYQHTSEAYPFSMNDQSGYSECFSSYGTEYAHKRSTAHYLASHGYIRPRNTLRAMTSSSLLPTQMKLHS